MKKLHLSYSILLFILFTGCKKETKENSELDPIETSEVTTAPVTDENYALAETQIIFTDYVKKIAAGTKTDGVGVFMHNTKPIDPKDRTVMRINFDTNYSFALLDLTEDAVLTMPETNGRYQSAWFITEEHYNPMALTQPGEYKLTKELLGNRYVMIVVRTQVNMQDPDDRAIAESIQEGLELSQKDKGYYKASHQWDMDEILAMRKKYMGIVKEKGMTSDVVFGKKGEVPLENHNCGTAFGWGGFTPDQAVYPQYFPETTEPATLTLKDVPVKAFWSITIYDKEGFPQGDIYNINSSFAKPNADGSVTIHFGGDKNADNFMDIFDGWNFTLRLYQPTEEYFNGTWQKPELVYNN